MSDADDMWRAIAKLERTVAGLVKLADDLYAGASELARSRCSCCRRCGATVPCRTAIRHEGCEGRCFCGSPEYDEDTPPEPHVLELGDAHERAAAGQAACLTCSSPIHGAMPVSPCLGCEVPIDYYSCAPGYCGLCAHNVRAE